jgi:exodeoxyribonuclease V beta subunit
VRDRHQALRLAEFFNAKNIPYVNQRGVSLTDSPALTSLILILQAVMHPRDLGAVKAALGSVLIGWTHQCFTAPHSLEPVLITFYRLRRVLFEQGFAPFFQSLLHSCWKTDGNHLIDTLLNREGGIDVYHDLQQLADLIIDHHYKEWNGPEGIIPFLDRLKLWQANEDERVKRLQDPNKEGVKILTLHFSKGLEFDIVFTLGVVNRTWIQEDLIPLEIDGKTILAPASQDEAALQRYFEELDAEKMRQLYVALTRAKYRLYIPVALQLPSEKLALGEASPMDLFLAKFNQTEAPLQQLYERMKGYRGDSLLEFLNTKGIHHHMTYSFCPLVENELSHKQQNRSLELYPPAEVKVPGHPISMVSFSSLARSSLQTQSEGEFPIPHDFNNSTKTVHTLPANYETGLLIHRLLEKISFQEFQKVHTEEQARLLISPLIPKGPFQSWDTVIASLIFNTLKIDLFPNDPFCLSHLEKDFYREIPFVFGQEIPQLLEGKNIPNGFVKGIIDCLFRHQGKYYLIDWKSNWLGPDTSFYQNERLKQAMQDNDYFLQATLYKEAVKRYLTLVDSRPFEECFGGIHYLFLRGLKAGQQTGIFFI